MKLKYLKSFENLGFEIEDNTLGTTIYLIVSDDDKYYFEQNQSNQDNNGHSYNKTTLRIPALYKANILKDISIDTLKKFAYKSEEKASEGIIMIKDYLNNGFRDHQSKHSHSLPPRNSWDYYKDKILSSDYSEGVGSRDGVAGSGHLTVGNWYYLKRKGKDDDFIVHQSYTLKDLEDIIFVDVKDFKVISYFIGAYRNK